MSSEIAIDTCVAIFLYERNTKALSKGARVALESSSIIIPACVGLELAFIAQKGRAKHSTHDILNFLKKDLGAIQRGVDLLDVCKEATVLGWTRDPFDRFIVAEVMVHKLPLVTSDRTIQEHYKKAIW